MSRVELIVNTEEETKELADYLAKNIEAPSLILLDAPMSAGKTFFSKAFSKGFGSLDDTSSPTYTIVNQYDSDRGEIYHLDLYRISDYDELSSIGLDDLMSEKAVLLIEWPEVAELDDRADLKINIEILDNNSRKFIFEGNKEIIDLLETFK